MVNGRVQNGIQFRDMVDAGDPVKCAEEAVGHGAGELLVTSIDRCGTGLGFDIELYQALAEVVDVPVTAFGGAGNIQHLWIYLQRQMQLELLRGRCYITKF